MTPIPARFRSPVQLINRPLRLDYTIRRVGFNLRFIDQTIGGSYEDGRGKAPDPRWHVTRGMHHKEEIKHPVSEVEQELAEVAIIIHVGADIAAGIIENDDAVTEILVEVFEGVVLIALDFVATGDHLADAPLEGHLLGILVVLIM